MSGDVTSEQPLHRRESTRVLVVDRMQASKSGRGRALCVCACVHECRSRRLSSSRGMDPVFNEARMVMMQQRAAVGVWRNEKRRVIKG